MRRWAITFLAALVIHWASPVRSTEGCGQPLRRCPEAFFWANNSVYMHTHNETTPCPIADFRLHANYEKLKNYKVLIAGDSLDLHACEHLQNTFAVYDRNYGFHKTINKSCYHDPHLTVHLYRFSSILNRGSAGLDELARTIALERPDSLVFNSAVWDLIHSHQAYCASRVGNPNVTSSLQDKCLCTISLFDDPSCYTVLRTQTFSTLQPPWCDAAFMQLWTSSYREVLRRIKFHLPKAHIFLRTHPHSSRVIYPSQCVDLMNDFVRELTAQLADEAGGGCRLINQSAMLHGGGLQHLGTENDANGTTKPNYRDGLHYSDATHMWTPLMLNTVFDAVLL